MNTNQIMETILKMAGIKEVPHDSGVFVEGQNIRKILAGIDMDTSDLLLAKHINADLVLVHHPVSHLANINFHKVMENQIQRMTDAGVPINKAQKALKKKKDEVERRQHAGNYDKIASAARLLGMPFMGVHLPADMITEKTLQEHIDSRTGADLTTLKEVTDVMNELDEYSMGYTKPMIVAGSESDYAGRILVRMAGGTGGGPFVFKAYFEAGVGTLVVMHATEDVVEEVKKQNIGNIIVAGHMSSDSIGVNIILDELEKRGLEIVRMAGIIGKKSV